MGWAMGIISNSNTQPPLYSSLLKLIRLKMDEGSQAAACGEGMDSDCALLSKETRLTTPLNKAPMGGGGGW